MEEGPSATATLQVENDRVRVTEWRFRPGERTGWHRHEFDYVVVPMSDGELVIVDAEGEHKADLVLGQSYARQAGVEHDVINAGSTEFAFIEVEIKAHKIDD